MPSGSAARSLANLQPWQPGQSGHPEGRPKGSRHKLQEAVIRALYEDFTQHGTAAIVKVRERKPEVYLMACVALLPKQAQKIESPFQDVSDKELDALEQHLAAIRAKLVNDIEASEVKETNVSKPDKAGSAHNVPSTDGVLEFEATDATVKD